MSVAIVDSGGANIASLRFALARLGCEAELSAEPAVIAGASHVLLPGVGAAADAMQRLKAGGLTRLLAELDQPVLGICLGMQLLFEHSDEDDVDCLGIIAGRVRRLEPRPSQPVPHMGWNRLEAIAPTPLLADIAPGSYAYFLHSYAVGDCPAAAARCVHGRPFVAAVAERNFYGAQFHPERSAAVGARLLRNFLALPSPCS